VRGLLPSTRTKTATDSRTGGNIIQVSLLNRRKFTTGHQARLFQTDARYLPLLTYKADFKAVAVALVAAGSSIKKPGDLKGKQVLGLSQASLVTLWGIHWLKENKVEASSIKLTGNPGKDPRD